MFLYGLKLALWLLAVQRKLSVLVELLFAPYVTNSLVRYNVRWYTQLHFVLTVLYGLLVVDPTFVCVTD